MPARVGDWLGLLFVVAIVYVLFRPQSRVAELITAIGEFMAAIVRRATDVTATT